MKYSLSVLALVLTAQAFGAPTPATLPASPVARTLELEVFGLNCSLCSVEMKTKIKGLTGARDIEPRLECGKIYLEMAPGAKFSDKNLSATLLANGFTYDGVKPSSKSISDIRKTSPDAC